HIRSPKLIERLDAFLGYPEYDPHGDPIPRADGTLPQQQRVRLAEAQTDRQYRIVAVKDDSSDFLQYAGQLGVVLDGKVEVLEKVAFDQSLRIRIEGREERVSGKFARQVWVFQEG
ncbi:metal-dependent transcriptional regulator, partial [Arthrospira platensis SPKY1]|nr:metal-dependent transcriptional regulator [Arthrospira platensis SPKY1]